MPPNLSIPTERSLYRLFSEEAACIDFLLRKEVFYKFVSCEGCGHDLELNAKQLAFRCDARSCRTRYSYRIYTLFWGSKLGCSQILHLGYLWLAGASWTTAQIMTGHSEKVITAFYQQFRILVGSTLEEDDDIIGGAGIEVQIDETKLGKRKYNKGHRVDGVWVIAGVEKTAARKVFLVKVEDRSRETINAIIRAHVATGSIIVTDMWKGYASVSSELGLVHMTVNHSENFRDPHSGACTNAIEGTNNALKMKIHPRNRTKDHVQEHLIEFIWRRRHATDLWDAFLAALKEIHYSFTD